METEDECDASSITTINKSCRLYSDQEKFVPNTEELYMNDMDFLVNLMVIFILFCSWGVWFKSIDANGKLLLLKTK